MGQLLLRCYDIAYASAVAAATLPSLRCQPPRHYHAIAAATTLIRVIYLMPRDAVKMNGDTIRRRWRYASLRRCRWPFASLRHTLSHANRHV